MSPFPYIRTKATGNGSEKVFLIRTKSIANVWSLTYGRFMISTRRRFLESAKSFPGPRDVVPQKIRERGLGE